MGYLLSGLGKITIYLASFFSLLFTSIGLIAQEEFIPTPSKLITSLPFNMFTGGVASGSAVGNFRIPEFCHRYGKWRYLSDSATCARLHLRLLHQTKRSKSPVSSRFVLYNQTLHINGLNIDSLDFSK